MIKIAPWREQLILDVCVRKMFLKIKEGHSFCETGHIIVQVLELLTLKEEALVLLGTVQE